MTKNSKAQYEISLKFSQKLPNDVLYFLIEILNIYMAPLAIYMAPLA